MLMCEVWDVTTSCWKYPIESSSSSLFSSSRMELHPTLHTPAWPKFIPFSATASFRRDFGHRARSIWRRLIISYGEQATGEIAANGLRATCFFPCDKNVFRPCDFPLSSEDKDAAPVNHPALVKTSDQASFSSANFSPFTSAEALRSSDISAVPSLNLKPNPRGGTAKKITIHLTKYLLRQLRKRI